jgi:membrane fusion protein (multidrug efflux system)
MERMSRLPLCLLTAAVLALSACKPKPAGAGSAAAGGFAVQVIAVPTRQQPVVESIGLVGTVTPNEMVELKSETDGIVREINFSEGQKVQKGDLLVALDDTKFAALLDQAEANLQLAKTSFDRVKQLLADKLISQQEYDQADANFSANEAAVNVMRRQLKDARVIAPFAGYTSARQISPGQVISKATLLTALVDLDTVKVEVGVPERYLGELSPGQQVEFTVAAYPKDSFKGEIYFISPQLDAGTRTALVKARIANPGSKLRGGMFASLNLTLKLRDTALVIPEPAIINNGDTTMVFAVTATNTVFMKPIRTGLRLAGKVEVLGGLSPGELVVVEGIQKLRPGAPVLLSTNVPAAYLN